MAYRISWKNSKGRHDTSYKRMNAVLDHVEYCLRHGWTIDGIYTVLGEGHNAHCVFPQRVRKNYGKVLDEEILALLKENGKMTVWEIATKSSCSCRTDSIRRTSIRARMYALRDKGLVERVPNWENESTWRLVPERRDATSE